MKEGLQFKTIVEFSRVFGEKPQDLSIYLKGISRSRLLNVAAFLLGFSSKQSQYADYKKFLGMFFCQENQQISKEIELALNGLSERYNKELIIFNTQSSLQLFEYCFDHLNDEDYQTKSAAEINIFKALLALNEQNTTREATASESTKDLTLPSFKLAAMALAQTYPYSELVNYELFEVLTAQVIKSVYLFEFLESNSQTKILLKEFLNYFDCSNWKDFEIRFLPLAFSVLKAEREAHLDINVTKGDGFKRDCAFIDKLIVSDLDDIIDYDFKKIRGRPFYKVSDGVYRIIFGLFVMEFTHKGLYFKLDEINKALPSEHKIKNFRSFYCDEFSEKELLYKTLNSIYQNRYKEYSGKEIKNFGIDGEPDYYIRNGNNLFLFESKDILINAEIKSSYDFNKYEPEFKKKLYCEEKKGKIEKKAVLQLIENVARILSKGFSFDTKYKIKSLSIYPILILHDRQFNLAGLNVIVNKWFEEELEKLKDLGFDIRKVKPLTIIDIDTLIFHQDILRDRTVRLEEILDSYFEFVAINYTKKYHSMEARNRYALRSVTPFSSFFMSHVKENKIIRVPKMFMDKGASVFS